MEKKCKRCGRTTNSNYCNSCDDSSFLVDVITTSAALDIFDDNNSSDNSSISDSSSSDFDGGDFGGGGSGSDW